MNRYYKEQFNKVLEYIHLNLDGKLDIKTLSEVAFISEYHFHRLIKSFLGEALGTYIKRIRIETGAKLLKYSDNSITDIAYKIGYETPTSFNKSFKKFFGISPGQFRENPKIPFDTFKKVKGKTNFELAETKKQLNEILILCLPTKGELGSSEIIPKWEAFIEYCSQNNLISSTTKFIGIHWDDPSITDMENIRYDVCVSIDKEIKSPFPTKKIEGGKYLCFTYKGDDNYLGDVYDQIFRDHIIKSDIKLRNQPPFEQYITNRQQTPPKERITEIYIPVL